MLKTYSMDGSMFIRMNDLKCMTVCAKKLQRKSFLQIVEYKNGDTIAIQTDKWVDIDLMGALYIENNNIKIYTELAEGQKIARVVICNHLITKKRLVEVIELMDGTILVNTLSKGVIKEKVEASIIELQLKHFFEEL